MKFKELRFFSIFLCLFVAFAAGAQVSMRTTLLKTVPVGKSMVFDVCIVKGGISGFTKFQIDGPDGIAFKQVDNKGGEFEFSENKARIVWVVSPADSIVTIRMKLLPVQQEQSAELVFKYYYLIDDNKKEFESFPFRLQIKDTVLPVFMSASMTELRSRFEPAIPLPAVKPAAVTQKSPVEVSQQVKQMRADAKEANRVGQMEKDRVNIKLDSLNSSIDAATGIADSTERSNTLISLNERKVKAQEDLAVAERVLSLAQSLEKQADEIERLSRENLAKPKPAVASRGKVQSTAVNQAQPKAEPKAGQVVEVPKQAAPKQAAEIKTVSVTEPGLIYKIQLGAFRQTPDLLEMKKAGDIHLVVEGGIYKVLLGTYNNREDAQKRRNEVSSQYPGCFVVTYQDGVRIK